ncbi:MAG: aldolase catalytic domain-containing protein [Lachnospiraceae bacterium]|nr:aldolase catalytic domain-containing protein [Lachnospiraceae bacterium]MDD6628754.1 aldolase catalytic domain-containing protein [Lachnospiraceae bacterium]
MRAEGRTLMSYAPDIKVLDCTLRDGGLVNDFYFTDEFVKALYQANIKAGVDYMEFGYKASKEMFDVNKFGKWKFCNDKDIREIVGDNKSDMKISVMADVGRCDFKKDILNKKDSPIDLIRIATYINTIPAAIEMIEDCTKKGYETTVNIMAISKSNDVDIDAALELLCRSSVGTIYLVDSYGSLYPEQVSSLAQRYLEIANKYGKKVGIHAHNNQQLAFANTIEAVIGGVCYLDATVSGMGRGCGNCPSEMLLGFLKNPKYRINPLLQFIESYIVPLRESGVVWGYDIPYLLTGILNQHPKTAIQFEKEKRNDYNNFYLELLDNF